MKKLNGLINVLKPAGMTSHDVVNRTRRILQVKKVGHTGTLDPDVTGVLPICVGKATKIAQFLTEKRKGYRGELTLGVETDTLDSSGQITKETDASFLSEGQILKAFEEFVGVIKQTPPMVSAVRYQGRKLYELAREGKEVERPAREVEIFEIKVTKIEQIGESRPKVSFEVLCSKGTYVRTLCADVGKVLKVGGHMSFLIRTKSGPFELEDAHTFDEIENLTREERTGEFLLPIDFGLQEMPLVKIHPSLCKVIEHGNPIFLPGVVERPDNLKEENLVRIYANQSLLAIAKVKLDSSYQASEQRIYFQPVTLLI